MKKLMLTAAFGDYDRTRALTAHEIHPQGIDLRILRLSPSEIFYRMCQFQEFDISEMSMGAHCYLSSRKNPPFVGIPAFLSRAFRHSMVYYHADSGIKYPEDLNGKSIAIREWGMTALVWIVGILTEEFGFDLSTVDWVAAKKPRVPIQMPKDTRIRYMNPSQNLSDMLSAGEVDAALIHQAPACYTAGAPEIKRMFPDYRSAEIDYYRRTGIHPIMHCVVLRNDWYLHSPWALQSIYQALLTARQKTLEALSDTKAFPAMIPMLPSFMEETRELFGSDFWPYGLKSNRQALEKLVLYAYQQGLSSRILSIEELFGENVRDL